MQNLITKGIRLNPLVALAGMLLQVNTWSNINSLFDRRELIVSGGIEFVTHPLLVSHRQSIRQVGKAANYCA